MFSEEIEYALGHFFFKIQPKFTCIKTDSQESAYNWLVYNYNPQKNQTFGHLISKARHVISDLNTNYIATQIHTH